MAISEVLKKAVFDDDITAIRSCFYTILLSDPGFKTNRFDEAINYVKLQGINIIDKHNGEELLSEEDWNEEYFDLLVSKLQDNFSEERIRQIKTVARKISLCNQGKTVEKMNLEEKDEPLKTYVYDDGDDGEKRYSTVCCPSNKYKKVFSNGWIGVIGLTVVVFLVIRHIFKGDK